MLRIIGGTGIACAADGGAEHIGAQGKGHGARDNAEIKRASPRMDSSAPSRVGRGKGERKGEKPYGGAENPDEAKRLPGDFFRFGFAACAQMLATCTEKPTEAAFRKPLKSQVVAGREADGSGGGRAQRAYHGRVHILYQCNHDLFHHSRPGQEQHRPQRSMQAGIPC